MLWIDPDSGTIVDANDAAAAFYGYSVLELRQRTIQSINQLTAEQVLAERLRAAQQQRNSFIFPHRLAGGSIRQVEVHSVPYRLGERTLLLSFIRDVSPQWLSTHEQVRYHEQLEQAVQAERARADAAQRQRQALLIAAVLLATSVAVLAILLRRQTRFLALEAGRARDAEHTARAALQREHETLRKLASARQRLQHLVHGTALATWDWDLQTDCIEVNDRWRAMLGYDGVTLPQLDGRRWSALLHPADRTLWEQAWARHVSGQRPLLECEVRLQHRDGRWITVRLRGQVVARDEAGHPQRAAGIALDVSAERAQQQALALADQVFNHTQEAILVTDLQQRIVRVNDAFTRLTGYTADEVLGRTPAVLASGRHDRAFFRDLWQALHSQGFWSGEIWNRRRDGSLMANWMSISAVRGPGGSVEAYVGLFHDITARKANEAELRRAALFDPLTGLGNRVLLQDRLEQALARSQRNGTHLAVVMLDLDGFKPVNDTYGHAAGDRLLVALAQRLRQCTREVDTVARLGGDEFVLVLPDLARPTDVEPLLERILHAAATPFDDEAGTLRVSASIGVTFYPQTPAVDAATLLQQADHAMYAAKRAGRNRWAIWRPDGEATAGAAAPVTSAELTPPAA
ncbi:sensor domain-containing protein [Tepidimonas charontis]|uniref:Cyclic di-GMP phosphodiesterase Gmr n=1 Tax=Tepidimonas charontis TaxID=2267262 RepID=A0A554XIP7_9BURK|nr:diguanylate cyclase [Tepidimonas charontis]TSE35668.1 Cyclic di-GMP phosphodiesterase Gmr [Tepidimonas charontis]